MLDSPPILDSPDSSDYEALNLEVRKVEQKIQTTSDRHERTLLVYEMIQLLQKMNDRLRHELELLIG